ncbi:MAG: hypothetical protein WC364_14545 [Eubacteriales bacterium]
MFKRIIRNKEGFVLVYVVMIVVLLIAVSAAALVYAESQSVNSIKQKNSMQAYYVTDAGIVKAKFWISDDVNGRLQANPDVNSLNDTTYNGGKIISAVLTGTGPYYLTCVGAYPNPTDPTNPDKKPKYVSYRTIVAKLSIVGGHLGGGGGAGAESYNPFKNVAVLSATNLDLDKDLDVNGDLYNINGGVNLDSDGSNRSDIIGNMYVNGNITGSGSKKSNINGNVTLSTPSYTIDTLDITHTGSTINKADTTQFFSSLPISSWLHDQNFFTNGGFLTTQRLANYNANKYATAIPVGMNFVNGKIYYITGNIGLSGTYTGNAVIVVNGEVTLRDLTRGNANSCLTILSTGDMDNQNGNNTVDALLYSSTSITMKNGFIVNGSVIAPDVNGHSNSGHLTANYNDSMANLFGSQLTETLQLDQWN